MRRRDFVANLGGFVACSVAAAQAQQATPPAAGGIMPASATLKRVRTKTLEIAYEDSGPQAGTPVLLMHGFPYDPRAYDGVVPLLVAAGCRTIVPYLRGYGPTRFLSSETLRNGQQAAVAGPMPQCSGCCNRRSRPGIAPAPATTPLPRRRRARPSRTRPAPISAARAHPSIPGGRDRWRLAGRTSACPPTGSASDHSRADKARWSGIRRRRAAGPRRHRRADRTGIRASGARASRPAAHCLRRRSPRCWCLRA